MRTQKAVFLGLSGFCFLGLHSPSFFYVIQLGAHRIMERKKPKPNALTAKHLPRPTSPDVFLFPFVLRFTDVRRGKGRTLSWYQLAQRGAWINSGWNENEET